MKSWDLDKHKEDIWLKISSDPLTENQVEILEQHMAEELDLIKDQTPKQIQKFIRKIPKAPRKKVKMIYF